jgi:hypothetical protein
MGMRVFSRENEEKAVECSPHGEAEARVLNWVVD